jgi:hypothetical protein
MIKIYTRILLVFMTVLFLSSSVHAQFPNPYCDVVFADEVEPISKVTFAGIVNSSPAAITATGAGNDLQDFTAIMGNVQQGLAYEISVEGNTGGNYSDYVAVYFDWNHDNDFEDAGEGYGIGAITNSNGLNGTKATGSILVPVGATLGNTRMRVVKLYGTYAGPCNTPAPDAGDDYGQAEDYTVVVAAAPPCLPVYGLRITSSTNTSISVAWDAVTGASNYQYAVTTSSTPPASGTVHGATSITENNLTPSTTYYFHIRANCGANGFSTSWSTLTFKTLCDPSALPYTENFNAATPAAPAPPDCMSVQNANGDGSSWVTFNGNGGTLPTKAIRYSYSSVNAANDWFFTKGLTMVAGDIYHLEFKYKASNGPEFVEKLEVKFGTRAGASAMTSPAIFTNDNIASALADAYATASVDFVVPTSETYYLGFRVFSDADQALLYVDDISIVKTGSLPITLTNFTGERQSIKNVLKWTTQTEQNNKGFELQRSADGVNYTSLGFTNSKATNGNSNSSLTYLFDDVKPFKGNSYYRLKQVDKDGKFVLSSVVLLKGLKTTTLTLGALYPNPTKSLLNLVVTAPANDKINILVTDMAGKLVMQQAGQMVSGDNNIQLNVAKLPQGSYMIKAVCAAGCETAVSKFVKQ